MSKAASAQGVAARGCARRFDLGSYVVFIARFFPRGSRFHHGHDDLLSYVVYYEGGEVLCDPGMPSYLHDSRWFASAEAHNGLRPALPLRMAATPLVPTSFAIPEVHVLDLGNRVVIEASNRAFGGAKKVELMLDGSTLLIRESVRGRSGTPTGFTHCLAQSTARLLTHTCVLAGELELTYDNLEFLRLERAERAVEYGERMPCARITGQSRVGTVLTRIRHV